MPLPLTLRKFERARLALGERLERLSASADTDLAKFRAPAPRLRPRPGRKRSSSTTPSRHPANLATSRHSGTFYPWLVSIYPAAVYPEEPLLEKRVIAVLRFDGDAMKALAGSHSSFWAI